ncbi:MAG: hypothetical protein M1830_005366 [Pleopsidium flavum]|nr:MAG: hypothetical protein M1830_005366 [Pleopsidium flavum]
MARALAAEPVASSTQTSSPPYGPLMLMLRSLLSRRTLLPCHLKYVSTRIRWQSTASTAKPQSPPHPASNTQNHNDLPTFLSYASRTDLDPTSTVYIGTHYEYTVLTSLRRLHLSLTRIGGRSDAGIDLLGQWHLPSDPQPLRVLVQCKALKAKAGPNLVRELEGAFAGAPVGWRGEGVVGMLVSPREATKGVREALGRSGLPLAWVLVGLEGEVRQCLWNQKAGEVGLDGVGVTVRYKPTGIGDGSGDAESVGRDLVLTWKGEVVEEHKIEDGS